MKISVLIHNFIVGDISGNTQKILSGYRTAIQQGAQLVASTELALLGYPPKDLILFDEYLELQDRCLRDLAQEIGEIPLIVGGVERNPGNGKPLYNVAWVIQKQQVIHTHKKILLPTYDVFDEGRYFEAGTNQSLFFTCQGQRVAVLICEDIWNGSEDCLGHKPYLRDPVAELQPCQPDILIVLNASPYYWGKGIVRYELVRRIARQLHCVVVYTNQVGGNDELVFDGGSFAVGATGEGIAAAVRFTEDVFLIDTVEQPKSDLPSDQGQMADLYAALVLGTRDYVEKIGCTQGACIALSGGIDSAIVACIAVDALGADRVLGVGLPSKYSSAGSVEDAKALAGNLGLAFDLIPIHNIYQSYGEAIAPVIGWNEAGTHLGDVTEENVQARIRGTIIMAISNRTGRIVLTTGNKSEVSVGYCTLYGDMVGGLAVIADVPKTTVYQLAAYVNRDREVIPLNTIQKTPSAELRPKQQDSDSLPAYDILDGILKAYIEEKKGLTEIVKLGYDSATVKRVLSLVNRNEFKRRQMTTGLKVTGKAFGSGRRWPIAARLI